MKLSSIQTSCQHQRVAFDCCIRGYGLITRFTGTHGNRKYVHLCKHHQERHKQCCATGLGGMWIYSSSNLEVSSFHAKRSDELMCESRNDSEAAGAVWVDSPCRRWNYLQPKWLELQTSELKASDSIYCFRYPRSGVPLWSIHMGLFQSKFSKTHRLPPQLCSGCSWPHPLSRKTMALFTLLSLEASDPRYLVLSPSSWERFLMWRCPNN